MNDNPPSNQKKKKPQKRRQPKELPEQLVDLILANMGKRQMRAKKKHAIPGKVEGMTEKLIKVLNGIDAMAASTGACCINGSCSNDLSQVNCESLDHGHWMGAGTVCGAGVVCSPGGTQ
jgi:hypothetical protein